MLRNLSLLVLFSLGLTTLSGCCLYCPLFCSGCGPYCGRAGVGTLARGYPGCVGIDDCYSDCDPLLVDYSLDPMTRARAQRLRQRRARALAAHGRFPHDGMSPYHWDAFAGDCCGCDSCGLPSTCGHDGGWALAPSCNCHGGVQTAHGFSEGDWAAQGWSVGPWVESSPAPQPTYSPPQAHPHPLPPAPANVPVPSPQPMDMTREQYYLPTAPPTTSAFTPATSSRTAATHVESSTGASPVQQVLWVPSGL